MRTVFSTRINLATVGAALRGRPWWGKKRRRAATECCPYSCIHTSSAVDAFEHPDIDTYLFRVVEQRLCLGLREVGGFEHGGTKVG